MHAGEEFLALGSAHENPHDGFISDRARPVPGSVLPQVSDCSLTYARPGANHGRGRRHRRIRGCRDRRPCRLFYHGKLQGPWYANARDPPSGRPGGRPRWVVQVARTDVCHVAPIRMPRSRSLPCCPSTSSAEMSASTGYYCSADDEYASSPEYMGRCRETANRKSDTKQLKD
jgi:hypothetical protein